MTESIASVELRNGQFCLHVSGLSRGDNRVHVSRPLAAWAAITPHPPPPPRCCCYCFLFSQRCFQELWWQSVKKWHAVTSSVCALQLLQYAFDLNCLKKTVWSVYLCPFHVWLYGIECKPSRFVPSGKSSVFLWLVSHLSVCLTLKSLYRSTHSFTPCVVAQIVYHE